MTEQAISFNAEHNRKAVRPYLTFFTGKVEGIIRLENHGIGPAIIDSIIFVLDDSLEFNRVDRPWNPIMKHLNIDSVEWTHSWTSSISPNKEIVLFDFLDTLSRLEYLHLLDTINSIVDIKGHL